MLCQASSACQLKIQNPLGLFSIALKEKEKHIWQLDVVKNHFTASQHGEESWSKPTYCTCQSHQIQINRSPHLAVDSGARGMFWIVLIPPTPQTFSVQTPTFVASLNKQNIVWENRIHWWSGGKEGWAFWCTSQWRANRWRPSSPCRSQSHEKR